MWTDTVFTVAAALLVWCLGLGCLHVATGARIPIFLRLNDTHCVDGHVCFHLVAVVSDVTRKSLLSLLLCTCPEVVVIVHMVIVSFSFFLRNCRTVLCSFYRDIINWTN